MDKFSMEAKVGLFFLACIGIFAYVWVKVLDIAYGEGFILTTEFRSVEGLTPGAYVQIAGIKAGSVKSVDADLDHGKVKVTLEVVKKYENKIPADSKIFLRSKGMLGDKLLVIEPGKPNGHKLKNKDKIENAVDPTDMDKTLEALGVAAQDIQALTREARRQVIEDKGSLKLESVMDNADAVLKDLRVITGQNKENISQLIDNANITSKNLNEIVSRNKEKINQTLDNTTSATKNANELIARNKEKLNRTVDDLEKFSSSMDKTSDKMTRLATDLDAMVQEVRAGKGSLGKLVSDEGLYRDAHGLVRDARGIADTVRNGRGSVARLIYDPELYFEARRAIRNMNKTAEDVSEAAPVSTLAIVVGSMFK